ncbi:hypothetical protein ACS0TY_000840 [Phlomoides rotata]
MFRFNGTNNEQLLNDEFYIGLNIKRATGQEYVELLDEFMCAVKQNYGEKVLVQVITYSFVIILSFVTSI